MAVNRIAVACPRGSAVPAYCPPSVRWSAVMATLARAWAGMARRLTAWPGQCRGRACARGLTRRAWRGWTVGRHWLEWACEALRGCGVRGVGVYRETPGGLGRACWQAMARLCCTGRYCVAALAVAVAIPPAYDASACMCALWTASLADTVCLLFFPFVFHIF